MTDRMDERRSACLPLLFNSVPPPVGSLRGRGPSLDGILVSSLFPRRDHLRGNKAAFARSDLHPSPRRGLSLKDEGVTAEYYSGRRKREAASKKRDVMRVPRLSGNQPVIN